MEARRSLYESMKLAKTEMDHQFKKETFIKNLHSFKDLKKRTEEDIRVSKHQFKEDLLQDLHEKRRWKEVMHKITADKAQVLGEQNAKKTEKVNKCNSDFVKAQRLKEKDFAAKNEVIEARRLKAQGLVEAKGKDAESMLRLMDALEDLDDVQNVYANFDITEEEMARLV